MGFYGKVFDNLGNYFNKLTFKNAKSEYSPMPKDDGVTISLSDQFTVTEDGIQINGELFNDVRTFSATKPSSPIENTIYIDISTNIMWYYRNGAWKSLLTDIKMSGEITDTTLNIKLG